jgi:hypothetical protein
MAVLAWGGGGLEQLHRQQKSGHIFIWCHAFMAMIIVL